MKVFASILAALILICASGALLSAIAAPRDLRTTHAPPPGPETQRDPGLETKQTTARDDVGDAREYEIEPGSDAAADPAAIGAPSNRRLITPNCPLHVRCPAIVSPQTAPRASAPQPH